MEALALFKADAASFVRLYAFLSQIFDYGNTEIEKRFLFFKQLGRVLDFGRERETVDLSQLVLTHHTLKGLGKRRFELAEGEAPKLAPLSDVGSGAMQDKQKALLGEIISKVNDLFASEVTDDHALAYVNGFLRSQMLASEDLQNQARNNSRAQFDNSPTLRQQLLDAVLDSESSFGSMSRQALDSEAIREGLLQILLGPGQLYQALRVCPGSCPCLA
jgi:type I restriction enzyme R subunit